MSSGSQDLPSTGSSLPTQTSNSGLFLTTNGTSASWASAPSTYTPPTGFGFLDSQLGSAPANAIYMLYQKENSVNWQCITESSSTATTTTTSTAVTAGWHHAQIQVNAAGTSVGFYMDGTLIATNTTNIPTAGVQAYFGYRKTLGSSAMQIGVDKLKIYTTLTTAR